MFERLELGAIAVAMPGRRALDDAERSLLYDAADRAALAIRQAQLHEEDHRIAVELQRAYAGRLPEVPGIELAAHYERPASPPRSVATGTTRSRARWTPRVVIGDVTGSGIPAASAMGQLRSVTRAYAVAETGRGRRARCSRASTATNSPSMATR